jgi:hypothetical protein
VIRAELIREIESLPGDDLQPRAIAILKAKNRLSADDAKMVEEVFAARMAQQEPSAEVLTTDQPPSMQAGPILSQPLPEPTEPIKRPRGRPRKIKVAAEPSASPPAAPKPIVDDSRPAPTPLQADSTPGKIDKSVLTISEPRRLRDKAHLKFVGSQPCLICARSPADAHHLRFTQPRAMGLKVSDEFTVPLCRTHHRDIHSFGDEVAWWERRAIDPVATARMLWISTRRIE